MFFKKKNLKKSITFATSCWENDWKHILLYPEYLEKMQIGNHCYDFDKKILIINNVSDYKLVSSHAEKLVKEKVITNFYIARDFEEEMLKFFNLKREDFKADEGYKNEWVFYNATGVLTAIFLCETDYLLFHTGDSFLEKQVSWIDEAIDLMEKKEKYKVANLSWNENFLEVKKESYKKKKNFYVSKNGFSDQLFLVKTKDFKDPIYNEIRDDSNHFPRGDVFEKRVFSFMKNHGWRRITYSKGSYTHKNI